MGDFDDLYANDPWGDGPGDANPVPELRQALQALDGLGMLPAERLAELLVEQMGGDGTVDYVLRQVALAQPGWLADLVKTDKALLNDAKLYEFERDRERRRRRIRYELDAEDSTTEAAPRPPLTNLSDLLNEPDEPVVYRIEDVWPVGGRVVLAAQNKAGKTTTVGNTIRSLVEGDPFLGKYTVEPVGRVVLLDDEMSRGQVRRWLAEQAIRKTDSVGVVTLRGALSSFNVLDPATRREWARLLRGADVVVLDCLRPVLDSLGLSEDKDSGRFLVALDELCREAEVGELLVVHHMGHSNERSRGDSRIEDWPDVKWRLVREDADDERSPRYFSAYGRDVDQPESLLLYDDATRHLTVGGGSRKQARAVGVAAEVLAHVEANPGRSKSEAEKAVGGKAVDVRAAIKHLEREGKVRIELGAKGSHLLYPHDPLSDLIDDGDEQRI